MESLLIASIFLLLGVLFLVVPAFFRTRRQGKYHTIRKSAESPGTAKRRLKSVDVQYISLVGKGANNKSIVYKGDQKGAPDVKKTISIIKTDAAKQLVFGVVYSPDEVDTHGDTMDATEIEKAAHKFLGAGRTSQIDKDHDEDPDEGYVVESYILSKADERFPDQPAGSWAVVIKVTNEDTWAEIEKGDISGISMQAQCQVEELAQKSLESRMAGFIDEVKKTFRNIAGKETQDVQKAFEDEMQMKMIRQAIWALESSLYDISTSEEITDKVAAMKADLDAFAAFIENPTQKSAENMKTTQKQNHEAAASGAAQEDNTSAEDLQKRIDALEQENQELKKAAPEKKSADDGRGGGDTTGKKVTKGLPIFSNF